MRGFRTHYDILEPLYIPVIIEVIYKPPIASEGFYKEDGFLVVGLSPGSYASHSLWYRIDEVIEKWGECIRDTW